MGKEEVWQQHKKSQNVEHAFRCLKSDHIQIRPYHRGEAQTRGHVSLCFLMLSLMKWRSRYFLF